MLAEPRDYGPTLLKGTLKPRDLLLTCWCLAKLVMVMYKRQSFRLTLGSVRMFLGDVASKGSPKKGTQRALAPFVFTSCAGIGR